MNDKLQKILAVFFGGVFGIVACGIIWFILTTYMNHYKAKSWIPVKTSKIDYEVKTSRSGAGSKSTTHSKLHVTYEYSYGGVNYSGDRADFSFGADNFSDKRIYRQLKKLNEGNVSVYVNPLNPSESIFDRSIPGPQIAFATFFLFFPCGIGTVAIIGLISFILGKIGLHFFDRFMLPLLGIIHGLPVVYPIIFDPGAFTFGAWIVIILFSILLALSVWAFIRRLIDPQLGLPDYDNGLSGNNPQGKS